MDMMARRVHLLDRLFVARESLARYLLDCQLLSSVCVYVACMCMYGDLGISASICVFKSA